MSSNLSLHSSLDTNKLIGLNFLEWHNNVTIVLKQEKKLYVLDTPPLCLPVEDAPEEVVQVYKKHQEDDDQGVCVMLGNMTSKLQRQHENMDAQTIILHLKGMFDEQLRIKRYETSKELFQCKMVEALSKYSPQPTIEIAARPSSDNLKSQGSSSMIGRYAKTMPLLSLSLT
eukprot:XP_015574782.1 uncharacterized protein LOC107261262 [Ricinus communis]